MRCRWVPRESGEGNPFIVRVEQEQFVFRTSELGKVEIEEIYKENMLNISLNLRL